MNQTKPQPFNAFTIRYDGQVSTIVTPVKLAPAFDPLSPPGDIEFYETRALWDTGATKSVITKATAQALKLIPIGNTHVQHAGGSSISNTYLANFFLLNNVGIPGVLVSECPDTVGGFGAIIGMDIIGVGDLSVTNVDNKTVMSFRIPSCRVVDYVEEWNRISYAGLNRYSPCPCGAKDSRGKPVAFGKCHGKYLTSKNK